MTVPAALLPLLACPRDASPLVAEADQVRCDHGHRYPVYDGIPVLLRDDVQQTGWWSDQSIAKARSQLSDAVLKEEGSGVLRFVQDAIGATNGILYDSLVGKLEEYPIPQIRLPKSDGNWLLDIGCNWGRWTAAAARKGYHAVGVDPNLDAVLAAREVSRQLGVQCYFAVGDARYLPFRADSFDNVFSYSVIQHLSKEDARNAIAHAGRVLRPGGSALIQMPNRYGIRSAYHQAKRRFSVGSGFDVRYWSPTELLEAFESGIGPSHLSVDGFFGLGIQATDARLLPLKYRVVVQASEWLRTASRTIPRLLRVADSLYVSSLRRKALGNS